MIGKIKKPRFGYFVLVLSCVMNCAFGSELNLVRDNLYKNHEGDLFFRSLIPKPINFKISKQRKTSFYLESKDDDLVYFYQGVFGQNEEAKLELRSRIDFKSWERISACYYIDKEDVFYVKNSSSGDSIHIVPGLNPKNLLFYFDGRWQKWNITRNLDGMDRVLRHYVSNGENIFYGISLLRSVDAKTFRFMEISDRSFGRIGRDKNSMISGLSKWGRKDFEILLKNLFDENGRISNRTDKNISWIKAFNKIAQPEFLIPIKK